MRNPARFLLSKVILLTADEPEMFRGVYDSVVFTAVYKHR